MDLTSFDALNAVKQLPKVSAELSEMLGLNTAPGVPTTGLGEKKKSTWKAPVVEEVLNSAWKTKSQRVDALMKLAAQTQPKSLLERAAERVAPSSASVWGDAMGDVGLKHRKGHGHGHGPNMVAARHAAAARQTAVTTGPDDLLESSDEEKEQVDLAAVGLKAFMGICKDTGPTPQGPEAFSRRKAYSSKAKMGIAAATQAPITVKNMYRGHTNPMGTAPWDAVLVDRGVRNADGDRVYSTAILHDEQEQSVTRTHNHPSNSSPPRASSPAIKTSAPGHQSPVHAAGAQGRSASPVKATVIATTTVNRLVAAVGGLSDRERPVQRPGLPSALMPASPSATPSAPPPASTSALESNSNKYMHTLVAPTVAQSKISAAAAGNASAAVPHIAAGPTTALTTSGSVPSAVTFALVVLEQPLINVAEAPIQPASFEQTIAKIQSHDKHHRKGRYGRHGGVHIRSSSRSSMASIQHISSSSRPFTVPSGMGRHVTCEEPSHTTISTEMSRPATTSMGTLRDAYGGLISLAEQGYTQAPSASMSMSPNGLHTWTMSGQNAHLSPQCGHEISRSSWSSSIVQPHHLAWMKDTSALAAFEASQARFLDTMAQSSEAVVPPSVTTITAALDVDPSSMVVQHTIEDGNEYEGHLSTTTPLPRLGVIEPFDGEDLRAEYDCGIQWLSSPPVSAQASQNRVHPGLAYLTMSTDQIPAWDASAARASMRNHPSHNLRARATGGRALLRTSPAAHRNISSPALPCNSRGSSRNGPRSTTTPCPGPRMGSPAGCAGSVGMASALPHNCGPLSTPLNHARLPPHQQADGLASRRDLTTDAQNTVHDGEEYSGGSFRRGRSNYTPTDCSSPWMPHTATVSLPMSPRPGSQGSVFGKPSLPTQTNNGQQPHYPRRDSSPIQLSRAGLFEGFPPDVLEAMLHGFLPSPLRVTPTSHQAYLSAPLPSVINSQASYSQKLPLAPSTDPNSPNAALRPWTTAATTRPGVADAPISPQHNVRRPSTTVPGTRNGGTSHGAGSSWFPAAVSGQLTRPRLPASAQAISEAAVMVAGQFLPSEAAQRVTEFVAKD